MGPEGLQVGHFVVLRQPRGDGAVATCGVCHRDTLPVVEAYEVASVESYRIGLAEGVSLAMALALCDEVMLQLPDLDVTVGTPDVLKACGAVGDWICAQLHRETDGQTVETVRQWRERARWGKAS